MILEQQYWVIMRRCEGERATQRQEVFCSFVFLVHLLRLQAEYLTGETKWAENFWDNKNFFAFFSKNLCELFCHKYKMENTSFC